MASFSQFMPGITRKRRKFNLAILIASDCPPCMVEMISTLMEPQSSIPQSRWPEDAHPYLPPEPPCVIPNRYMPHPEQFMNYIAKIAPRGWNYILCESLVGMRRKFAHPYIIFYPEVPEDGKDFPVNECIKEIQGKAFREDVAWRGNIVIAKYQDDPFTSIQNASMADFAILKNWLMTNASPRRR